MRARLRRGIGKSPGALPEVWAITLVDAPVDWHSHDGKASMEENAVHTALTLYALHRQGKIRSMSVSGETEDGKEKGDSIGSAAARLIQPNESNMDAIKRRFDAMATASDFIELAYHARGIIQLLKATDLPLNYPRFAYDLHMFQFPWRADRVRLRWGEDFYRVLSNKNRKEIS